MASLPLDLQKLPPQALDLLRFLATQEDYGSWVDEILEATGLTERGFGKAIRRLVTRYYVEMRDQGYYVLTASGQQAADDIRAFDAEAPAAAPVDSDSSARAASPRQSRQFSVVVPKELVARSTVMLRAGFSAPAAGQPALTDPGRIILRVSAPGCDVEPSERPLDVGNAAAGPFSFSLTPRREGPVRVKVEAYQLVTPQELAPLGGMFFDLTVAGFPTPASSAMQALGATLRLRTDGVA